MGRLRAGLVSTAAVAVFAVSGCGAAPGGRLGADPTPTTTRPGTPADVLNTTTTAASVTGNSSTPSGSAGAQGPGSAGSSGGPSTGQPQHPSSGQSPASPAGIDESSQVAAMMDCLRGKGINVPPPSTDSSGKVVYDQTELAKLAQDPKAQAAADQCSAQLAGGR